MCTEIDRVKIVERLNSMIGQPHEPPEGCLKFVKRAYLELGVKLEQTGKATLNDWRQFQKVERPEFGVTVIFENVAQFGEYKFHVGLMLDDRWCIQSSTATCGVGRIEITRHPFNIAIRGFYKPACFF